MTREKRKYQDRSEYLKTAVSNRRRKLREMAVEYKGGKCQICGYNKCKQALEFHHINSDEKDFGISASGSTKSWFRIKEEIDKCIMLCANCHHEVHIGITQLPQVIVVENKVNCGKPKSEVKDKVIRSQAL